MPKFHHRNPKFYDRNDRLSAYALACGYVETKTLTTPTSNHINVTLWHEHATYHVRVHDHDNGKRLDWSTYNSLYRARRRFDDIENLLTAGIL